MKKEKLLDKYGNHIGNIIGSRVEIDGQYYFMSQSLIDGFKCYINAKDLILRLNLFGMEKHCTDPSHYVLNSEDPTILEAV
jgi:hypothetical protein